MDFNNRNKKGTGFTNIGRILEASKGSRLGQQVAGGIAGAGQQVRTQIGKAGEVFKTESEKESERFGEKAEKERAGIIGDIASGSEGLDENKAMERFADYRSGEYRGPRTIKDYDTLSGKAQETEQLGRLSQTSGGKEELLRRFGGVSGDYSKGERRLDSALLGLTGQKQLSQAQRSVAGLSNMLGETAGGAAGRASQLEQKAKRFGEETIEQLQGVRSPITEALRIKTQEAQQLEKNRADEYSRIQELLANPNIELTRTAVAQATTPEEQAKIDKINEHNRRRLTAGPVGALIGGAAGTTIDGKFYSYKEEIPLPTTTQRFTNADLAVQNLASSKFLSPEQADELRRYAGVASGYGLDIAKYIGQGLTENQAKNIQDASLASTGERDRLALIDRLMGKQGTQVGLQSSNPYEQGKINLNLEALKKAVADEAAKRREDLVTNLQNSVRFDPLLGVVQAAGQTLLNAPGQIVEGGANAVNNVVNEVGTGVSNVVNEVGTGVSNVVNEVGGAVSDAAGTVICTELHNQGIMSSDIYKKDIEYGKMIWEKNPDVIKGYHFWAIPLAGLMKKSKVITKLVSYPAMKWANQMAGVENSIFGQFAMKIGQPICGIIGKFISKIGF